MHDLVVHYKGFAPNQDTVFFFDHLLDHVHDESINTRAAHLHIAKIKNFYEATFEMGTPRGRLISRATGLDVHELGRKVLSKLRKQVERRKTQWKPRHG